MAATRLASACACSSETPGLRRAYAKKARLFLLLACSGDTTRGIHTSVSPRDPMAATGNWNAGGMTPVIGVAALVERDGAADDVAPAAKAPPEGGRDDGAAVVGEPLAEQRRTEFPREGRRHGRAGDELRLAWRRQMESAGAEPAERVEARCLLLVVLQLEHRHRHHRAGLVVLAPYSEHEALAVRVGQRPQQHAVDDGEDGGGRADPDGKRDHGEQRDAGRRFPGGPGLGEGR